MAYEIRAGGAMFSNDRKTSDKQPDYKGDLRLDSDSVRSVIAQHESGVEFPKLDISGWKKTSGKGTRFLSIASSKPWEKDGASAPSHQRSNPPSEDFGDEVPF